MCDSKRWLAVDTSKLIGSPNMMQTYIIQRPQVENRILAQKVACGRLFRCSDEVYPPPVDVTLVRIDCEIITPLDKHCPIEAFTKK